jgi:hypothetical protein
MLLHPKSSAPAEEKIIPAAPTGPTATASGGGDSAVAGAPQENRLMDELCQLLLSSEGKACTQQQLEICIIHLCSVWNTREKSGGPSRTHRMIAEKHVLGCRCSTCCYTFQGDKDAPHVPAAWTPSYSYRDDYT